MEISKEYFVNSDNMEQIRLKLLEDKIKEALTDFKDTKIQWTDLRLEKILLETLLDVVKNRQIKVGD